MAFLLLLVSLTFSFVFSIFSYSTDSLEYIFWFSQSAVFPILFMVLWILWFSYFFFIVWKDKSIQNRSAIDIQQLRKIILLFFQNNLYYIGFVFLYMALYFIIWPSVWYNFSYFICISSFLILGLFFISEKFSLFRDLIKINTILFSLYYIFSYLFIFFTWNNFFIVLDFLNQIFILAFFILNIYNDKTLLKNKVNDNTLVGYSFIYLLLFFVFYLSQLPIFLSATFCFVGITLSFILKNFITDFSFFKGNESVLKILSILFWYIALFFSIIYTFLHGFNLFISIAAIYLIIDNIIIHKYFQNYISLGFSLLAILFYYFYFYYKALYAYEFEWYLFLLYGYFFYFWVIAFGYIERFTYEYDYYFIYSALYFSSIISMLYFLFGFRFELFGFWVMLLLQSIITFMVYYQFNRIKSNEQQNHLS